MTNVIRMRARAIVAVAAVAAIASIGYGDTVTNLTSGVPVPGLSGAAASEAYYKIVVPSGQGQLQISISGGTGDCDLYVRRGSLPSYFTYDYRPYLSGNNETVTVTNPAADTWYIMLRGRSAYSGVTLVATCQPAIPVALGNGVPQNGLSGDNSDRLYYIDVPAGQSILEVNTWGGMGDVDLFVKHGSVPDSSYDGHSAGPDTQEAVSISNPAAGKWYILLRASDHYSDVTLRALYSTSGTTSTLRDGVPITGLSGALGSEACYVLDVPSGIEAIDFSMSGGTGNCDMYIKKGARPTTSDWDYRPVDSGNNESISISGSDMTGSWYVLLVGKQAYSGVTLKASLTHQEKPVVPDVNVPRLAQGVPVTNLSGKAGSQQFFSIDVPSDATNLVIKIGDGTGDADLYVRQGSLPTTTDFDYRPYLTGNNEQVTVPKPAAGTWYIMVRGYQAFAGVTLTVTFDSPKPDDAIVLLNGVALTGLAGGAGSEKYYKIVVPTNQTRLEIAISGGWGDADLYVRLGDKPTTRDWDYRPFLMGNNETVTIDEPKAGTYYILLRGYMPYSNVTLLATYGPAQDQVKALTNCVPVSGLSGALDSEALFKIDVPAGQDSLRIEISGGTGDADLYVKKGDKPTTKSWDYHPGLHGNNEVVIVPTPAAATWYILVQGYQAYAGVTLQACFQAAKHDDGGSKGAGDCGCGGGGGDGCGGGCGGGGGGGCGCGIDDGGYVIIVVPPV